MGYGHTQAADTELSVVQTAMDAMMAVEDTVNVTVTAATNDMATFPGAGLGDFLYPKYLRDAHTNGTYSCDGGGKVTRATTGYE